jgi:branched-chain amino acid aminotransferase
MEIAADLGYDVIETEISRIDMYTADEVFMTGTAAEITTVAKIDDRPIGDGKPGAVGKALASKYADVVRGKDAKYEKWLDRI